MNVFLTGDTHGNFDRIKRFCGLNNTTKDDVLIILGGAGINYYLNERDYKLHINLMYSLAILYIKNSNFLTYFLL